MICGSVHPSIAAKVNAVLPFVIPSEAEEPAVRLSRTQLLGAPLPRFPAEACGVDTLHAPFLNERRTRGSLCQRVAGNRGQARFWLEWDTTALDPPFLSSRPKRSGEPAL